MLRSVDLERKGKKHNIGFPSFKLLASTKHLLRLNRLKIFLTVSV